MNQNANYLDQQSFSSKVIVQTYTHTPRPIALPGPLKWLGKYSVSL